MLEYELMYIVPSTLTEEEAGSVEQAVGGMLSKVSAAVVSTKRLGKLRLAYPIKRQVYGHYVLVRFQSEPAQVAALNELLRLAHGKVLRHLILRADEAGDEKYDLVQFQEVNVEDRSERARRTRPSRTEQAPAVKEEDKKAQKEGVAALETSGSSTETEAKSITSEELDKKIDEALEEKA